MECSEKLIPAQSPTALILNHPRLEEVLLLLQVDHLAHPREGVGRAREHRLQTDLLHAAVTDETQVVLEHRGVQAQHAARHGVFGVGVFQVHGLLEQAGQLSLECLGPQMGVFHLDGVDQVDAEVTVHRLVAQDVLVLLGGAGHLVLAAQGQNLHEAHIEEHAFHDAGEHDQALQELLVRSRGAGLEVRVGQRVDEGDEEIVLVADRLDLVIGVEDFGFIQTQAFHDVLVGVGVDRFFEGLAQQELAAFRRGDVAVGAQHDVVGGQRVGRDEETEVALDQTALVFGQAVRVLPQLDIALHIDFLRHPVVGAGGQVFLPGPFVLERHQLVHIGAAIDDALVHGADAAGAGGLHAGRVVVGSSRRGFEAVLRLSRGLWRGRLGGGLCGGIVPRQHVVFSRSLSE